MNILQETKKLNKKISLLKESIIPSTWNPSWKKYEDLSKNFKILNEQDFFNIIKYSIKNQLEEYENNELDASQAGFTEFDPENDLIVRFKNWLFPNNESALRDYVALQRITLFAGMLRRLDEGMGPGVGPGGSARLPVFDKSSFKCVCKVQRMSDGGSFLCAATVHSKKDNKDLLVFFNWGFNVKLRFDDSKELEAAFKNDEIEIDPKNLQIDDFFTVYSSLDIRPNNRLIFPITKKSFSLNNIPNETFDYIDKSVLYHREYIPKLQKIGTDLTEAKFADMIKNREKIDLF